VASAATVAMVFALAVVPVLWIGWFLTASYVHETLAYDFRNAYLPAAEAVLDGESPYPELNDPRLANETAYVYPPLLAWALIPLTPLSENAASILAALGALALVAGTLLVLGVRDWRCYGAVLLWSPTLNALHTASASLLLVFAAALVWRFRDRPPVAAAALGLGVAVKLVIWPLGVWALATRRLLVTGGGVIVAVAVTLAGWAALRFEGLTHYPDLLDRLQQLLAETSYSVIGVLATIGVEGWPAQAIAFAIGGALLAACFVYGRRGEDVRSLTAAIAAALALTPILWQHYLVLLLVPLAVARPRFSGIWLIPAFVWLAPRGDNGTLVQTWIPAIAAIVVVALLLRRAEPAPSSPSGSLAVESR
jgi:alpha-1,2-mannosyltransferase